MNEKKLKTWALLGLLPVASGGLAQALQAINPGLAQTAPIPSTCPAGTGWTTHGSGIAHCVADDPVCTGTTELTHDALGNPSCFVPIIVEEDRETGCTGGKVGSRYQVRNRITHANGSVSYSAWKTVSSDCTAPPLPPPPSNPPPVDPPPVTPPPVTTPPPGPGPVGDPPVGCTPVYTPSSSTDYCSGGKVGSITTSYVTNSCTGAQTVTGQTGSCACPSGTNWNGSQCVPAPPPPPSCPAPSIACSFTQLSVIKWTVSELTWVPYGNSCKSTLTVIATYYDEKPSEC